MELHDFKHNHFNNSEQKLENNFSANNNIKNKSKHNRKKNLPENFFERVIEYEMKLKYDFTMDTLNDLAAIEFYESKDDLKYRDYQNRLNILLSQPDILKNINKFNTQKNSNISLSSLEKKMKKEREKKQIKMKINYIAQINNLGENNKQVNKIIDEFKQPKENLNLNEIVGDDISKQENDFKSRLLAKRKSKMVKKLIKLKKEIERSIHISKSNCDLTEPILENNNKIQSEKILLNTKMEENILNEENDINNFTENKRENEKNNLINNLNNIFININSDIFKNKEESKIYVNENDSDGLKTYELIENNQKENNRLNKIKELNKSSEDNSEDAENKYNIPGQKIKEDPNSANDNENFNPNKNDKNNNKFLDNLNLDNSFGAFEQNKLSEIDELFSPFDKKNSNYKNNNSNGINLNLNQSELNFLENKVSAFKLQEKENILDNKPISNKHKQAYQDIHNSIESFVNEFNYHFYDHVFQKFTDNIQRIMDEKYTKYIEICKHYNSNIKEMEFLLSNSGKIKTFFKNFLEENQNAYKESINIGIDSMKEEQAHELDRIDDQFNKLINDAENEFKNNYVKKNPGIQLLEEKFKLDMYNLINSILLPRK